MTNNNKPTVNSGYRWSLGLILGLGLVLFKIQPWSWFNPGFALVLLWFKEFSLGFVLVWL